MPRKSTKTSKKTYKSKAKGTYAKPMTVVIKKKLPSITKNAPLFALYKWARINYYEQAINVTGAAGAVGGYAFSANGAYDPNISGIGHQPIGFDNMMGIYEHYFVTYSKISVTFSNQLATPCVAAIWISPDSAIVNNPNELMENGQIVRTILNPKGTDGAVKSLSLSCNIAKENGIKSVLIENDYRGNGASNPVEQTYFVFGVFSNFEVADAKAYCSVLMEMSTKFTEPRKMIGS